jgi:hypothetical protein
MNALSSEEAVSLGDYAAVDKVLRQIDRENAKRDSLENFAYWKLGFKFFRDLELDFERAANRQPYEAAHRAMLTTFLAITEVLKLGVENFHDSDLSKIGLSKASFAAATRYLRMKYNQWYAPVDPKAEATLNAAFA